MIVLDFQVSIDISPFHSFPYNCIRERDEHLDSTIYCNLRHTYDKRYILNRNMSVNPQ